jgi:regulator of protease activity HflC (stomatin/prohibitin superfamily)
MNILIDFVILPIVLILLVTLGVGVFKKGLKIVQEYERAVIFRLGRLQSVKGPGLFVIVPFLDVVKKVVDLRVITLEVPRQEVITRDNVTVSVDAVVYFRVVDPAAVVVQVEDYWQATSNIAQTTLRDVMGQSELDELLAHREEVNRKLQGIIDQATKPWGIKVRMVEVRDMELPESMQRAMAKQAEAEREKQATIIHASGELEASRQLVEAAHIMSGEPDALQLRYLQTLTEVSAEKNSTIIFPVPLEFLRAFMPSLAADTHGSSVVNPATVVVPQPAGQTENTSNNNQPKNMALLNELLKKQRESVK